MYLQLMCVGEIGVYFGVNDIFDCLLYREIKNNQDQIDMQRDLDALMDWGSTWGMKFNAKSVTLCGSRVLANLCSISTV